MEVSRFGAGSSVTHFDLELNVAERDSGLVAALVYNTDLFDAPMMENMGRHLTTLLRSIVREPDQRVSDLTMLTESERSELTDSRNAIARMEEKTGVRIGFREILIGTLRHAAGLYEAELAVGGRPETSKEPPAPGKTPTLYQRLVAAIGRMLSASGGPSPRA